MSGQEQSMAECWERWRDHIYKMAESDVRVALKRAFELGHTNGCRDVLNAMAEWRDMPAERQGES